MPVLKIYFKRLEGMTGLSKERALDRLPYLGLDIESVEPDSVRIEYNPNRADFSSDYGIARALKGLVGTEKGVPIYKVVPGKMVVNVDANLTAVRPYVACAVARGLRMDDETVRQLISMQEDLHNGIGRKRKKTSIGLHNLDPISPPINYHGVPRSFEFTPLGSGRRMNIEEVLQGTETGRQYAHILSGARAYPLLQDSKGLVLSFPPIINGADTKVDSSTKNLFVDVTSTDQRIGDEALAIICSALADAGGSIESVSIKTNGTRTTPDLSPSRTKFDQELTRAITGLDLTQSQMRDCLRSTRLDLDGQEALIPRYRVDILHPVDLAEEVAIGYGLDRMDPSYPASKDAGGLDRSVVFLDGVSDCMARAGFTETMNYELVDEASLYRRFSRSGAARMEVENPRTTEHYLLRDSLLPSLMSVLSRSINAVYPQRVYEVGRVYLREGEEEVLEESHLGALIAHSASSFSEAKMYLDAVFREKMGTALETRPGHHWAFDDGRCAAIILKGKEVGYLGELRASAVAAFGLDLPVAGFEMDLSGLA